MLFDCSGRGFEGEKGFMEEERCCEEGIGIPRSKGGATME